MLFRLRAGLLLALFCAFPTAAQACEADLSGLSRVLPEYPQMSELVRLREQILMTSAEQLVGGQGAERAADAYTGYLLGLEASQPQAEACVRKQSRAPDHTLAALAQGRFAFGQGEEVEDACAASYVRYLYSRAEADAAARVADCRASQE